LSSYPPGFLHLLFLKILGAFFDAARQKTGLFAPIPRSACGAAWNFRFYPLRPTGFLRFTQFNFA
jgi:hypothetical protein